MLNVSFHFSKSKKINTTMLYQLLKLIHITYIMGLVNLMSNFFINKIYQGRNRIVVYLCQPDFNKINGSEITLWKKMILEYSFKNIFKALLKEAEDEEGVNNSSQKKINHEMIPDAHLLHIFLIYLHIQNQGEFKASVI